MDFSIPEEYMMLKDSMKEFVKRELLPLEKTLLERELSLWTKPGHLIPEEDHKRLLKKTKDLGFWGLEVDEEFGGQGLGMLAKTLVVEELSKSLVGFSNHGFTLPPDAPNLYYLHECCGPRQREKYFVPYCNGDVDSAMGICVLGDRIIVSCSPNVLVFTKDDNDDRAEREAPAALDHLGHAVDLDDALFERQAGGIDPGQRSLLIASRSRGRLRARHQPGRARGRGSGSRRGRIRPA